jgi:hypothetical protein
MMDGEDALGGVIAHDLNRWLFSMG